MTVDLVERPKRAEISEWSAKSRLRMTETIAAVDWTPFVQAVREGATPGMVTLTVPGDWLAVAPDGEAFKYLVNKFRKRFESAWGQPISGAWKLEFQKRGAPHLHILTVPPTGVAGGRSGRGLPFAQWLSLNWAEIVDASREPLYGPHHELTSPADKCDCSEFCRNLSAGTGVDVEATLRYGDPKRIAVYFTKHGLFADKAYQNVVPEAWQEPGKGPGRFWGVWVLDVVKANVEIADNAQFAVSRHLRKVASRSGYSRKVSTVRQRVDFKTGEIREPRPRKRPVNRRVKRMRDTRGFVTVNDGPAAAVDIARIISAQLHQGDFFGSAPDHEPRSVWRLHEDFNRANPFEPHEGRRAEVDSCRCDLLGVDCPGHVSRPVGAGREGDSDVLGGAQNFVSFLSQLRERESTAA